MGTRKRFFIMKTIIFLAFVGLVSGQIDGRPEWTPRSGNGTCAEMPEFMLNADRIVGGEDAPSPIPWQVAVLSGSFQFCGATILDESTLLCAAHCQVSTSHSIRAGSVNKKSGGQVRNIAQVMNNIQYNPNTFENDFAILKLDSPLELDDDVKPACLPTSSDYLDVSSTEEECFTSGWGTLSSGGFSTDACQFVRVPAITNAECNADYGGSIADSMICAGYPGEGGKDACQGDSGGLVVIIMQLDGITIVQLVNVLILMLVQVQIVKTNGRPRSVKNRQTRENVTRKKSKRTAKKPVTCAKQNCVYIYPFAFC